VAYREEKVFSISAPILAASYAAGLEGKDAKMARQLAALTAKHKELLDMPGNQGRAAYDKLNGKYQRALQTYFGNTEYNPEQQTAAGIFGTVANYVSNAAGNAVNALSNYGNIFSNVYRSWVIRDDLADFFTMDNWDDAWDGNKIFEEDLEAEIDQRYDANVRKIAKQFSMGKTYGEVLGSLDNEEEFEAFVRFNNGDEEFRNAMRDYEDAKISWGRSLARGLGLNPDIGVSDQGLEGTLYSKVSGVFDLAGDIAFDPLTYAFGFGVAMKGARFGLSSLMKAENALAGVPGAKLGFTQNVRKMSGLGYTYDDAFKTNGVRKAFDEAGSLLQTIHNSKLTEGTRLAARQELKTRYTFFDDVVIDEFGKAKVFDADGALEFFKKGDTVDAILMGRTGSMTRQLPRHLVTTDMKQNLRKATWNFTGYSASASAFNAVADDVLSHLEQGKSLADNTSPLANDIKTLRGLGDRSRRMFERALIDRTVFVGGTDKLGRSLKYQSRNSIYTVARTVLPRYHANVIADAFVQAKSEGAARRIISGLFDTVADSMGIARTGAQKRAYDEIMGAFKNPMYGEEVALNASTKKALFGKVSAPDRLNPTQVNGLSLATAEHHLAKQAILPNIGQLVELVNQKPLLTAVSNTINHRHVTAVTDMWSALNLLPRLGLRSLLDENLFHYLTMPVIVLPLAIKGYAASVTRRVVTRDMKYTRFGRMGEKGAGWRQVLPGGQKDLGFMARAFQKLIVNMDDATRQAALSGGVKAQANIIEQQMVSNKVKGVLIGSEDAKYLSDVTRWGHTKELENLASGFNRAASDGVSPSRVIDTSVENLNINVAKISEELKLGINGGAPILVRNHQPDFQLNFIIQLNNRVDRNGAIGKLAVQHMENPAKAVDEIIKHFKTPEGKLLLNRFERSQVQSVDQIARDMYLHVRSVFQNDAGELNTKLLNKVRTPNGISAREIGLDDLDEVADMLPVQVMGYATTIPSYRTPVDFMQALFDRGFQIADRQVATLSREPAYYGYYLHFRRQLASQETRYAQKLADQGLSEKAAARAASERYTFVANEMSLNRVLGFIDNPNVRSNTAFGMRNLARYYRAQEDFYRRAFRAASNPATLIKLRLSAEGLDNAGFIHEDEYGEKYFFFPVDEIMYNVYAPIIEAMGGDAPKLPMPLQLTGKIKMITPSLDPESAMPTFSSPLMALSWGAVRPLVPIEWTAEAERLMFGPYAENRDLGEAITPSAIRKFMEVAKATQGDVVSEQVTSAAMKAAAFYTANGMGPNAKSGITERALFAAQVQATARNIVAIRNLLGIFSPVSPSIATNADVPEELLGEEVITWKSEFNKLVQAEYDKGNAKAYETALMKWTKIHPGRLAYTVSETETDRVASIQKTKQSIDWMKKNNELVKTFPQASMFLMPQAPGYDITAYAFLKHEGYIKYKPLEDYFTQIATVKAENEYSDMRKEYEEDLASANTSTDAAMIRYDYENKRSKFLSDKPYLKLAMEPKGGNQIKEDIVDELRLMTASDLIDRKNPTIKNIVEMVRIYDYYDGLLNSVNSQSDAANLYKRQLRWDASTAFQPFIKYDANAKSLYEDIFRRLLGV
jgi:hypothetical protein